jgi:hypothetical protein
MDRIKALITLARSRERFAALVRCAAVGLLVAAILLALLVLVAKVVPGTEVPDRAVFIAAAGGGALGFFVAWFVPAFVPAFGGRRRPTSDAQLALRIDERLKLDERLTTALAFERSTDSYARAAVADGVAVASDPALRGKVRAAFPVRVPMSMWITAPAAALLVAAQIYLPAIAWPKEEVTPAEEARLAQKKASEDALERVKEELESTKALPQDVRDSLSQLAKNAEAQVGGEAEGEEARRETIRRMSELQNRLDQLKKSDEAMRNEAMKRDLAGLEKQDGPLSKFSEDLAKGDFASAKQQLEELARKAQSGEMSDAEKASAAQALEQMSKSLDALADKQQSLKDELARAGLDQQLASNPEALERAISENQNLTEQQRQQLQQAVAASKASQQALQKVSSAAKKAADQKKQQQQKQQQQKNEKKQQQKQNGEKKDGQQQQGGDKNQQQQQQQQGGSKQEQQSGDKQQQQQQQQQQGGQAGECENPGGGEGEKSGSQGQRDGQSGSKDGQEGQQGQQGQQASGSAGSEGGDAGSAEALAELAQSLSELEQVQQMMQEAEALSNMAQQESQSLGEGMCKGGSSQQGGQNAGQGQQGFVNGLRSGAGRAQGGNSGKAKTPTGTKVQKAKTQNAGGDIIARQLIDNPNPEVAESVMPVESIEQAADGGSGVAVGEDQVPSHLKETHKHYFGTLKKELKKRSEQSGGGADKPSEGGAAGAGSTSDSKK